MRQLLATALVLAAAGAVAHAAEKVEVKGVHLCCGACIKAVGGILKKVDGVSDPKCDKATQTVTFTAKDAATADKAFQALMKGGFYGQAKTDSGTTLSAKDSAAGAKGKEVTVTGVHVCCKSCQKAVQKLFPGATISYTGQGAQRDVTIAGDNLDAAAVLTTLRSGGFNGNVQKK